MSDDAPVDAEAVEVGTDLAPVEPQSGTLFRTDDPMEVVERASKVANALKDVLRQQRMVANISGREHVQVEGWTTLGSMLGVVPVVEWTRKTDDGWEARVEARTLDGRTVGAAEAMCSRGESKWKNRDDYALRSMAQTRATSKALRGPLGFVVTLAGFESTPADEMPDGTAPATGAFSTKATQAEVTQMVAALGELIGSPDAAAQVTAQLSDTAGYMPGLVAAWVTALPAWRAASVVDEAKTKLGAEEVKA